jgi:predicted NodU family carbamoyl transferase
VLTLWSYYRFSGSHIETLKKIWLESGRGFLSEEFFNMPGLGAYYSRASTYIFGDWNKCGELMGLAPYGRPDKIKPLLAEMVWCASTTGSAGRAETLQRRAMNGHSPAGRIQHLNKSR